MLWLNIKEKYSYQIPKKLSVQKIVAPNWPQTNSNLFCFFLADYFPQFEESITFNGKKINISISNFYATYIDSIPWLILNMNVENSNQYRLLPLS